MKIPEKLAAEIVNPKAYADLGRIHDVFSELRRTMPLAVAHPDKYDPFWVATKFDDVMAIERSPDLFEIGDNAAILDDREGIKKTRALTGGSPHQVRTIVHMDDPDHRVFRELTHDWFMPKNLGRLEARVRKIATRFIDKMEDMGTTCDFARDIALYFPLHTIMQILGVPEKDEHVLMNVTQQFFSGDDPDLNLSGRDDQSGEERADAIAKAFAEFAQYFMALTQARRKSPQDDVASVIANGIIYGKPIADFEAISYYAIIATAGHDTTSASIASGLWALCENPAQMDMLRKDHSLIPGLVEESIRWETPVKHFMRTVKTPTSLRGQNLAKGDWLLVSFASANRDEDNFDAPFTFDITRKPNRHMALGHGPHICLGQHLARLEMRIFWEEFLPRCKHIELAGEPTRSMGSFVNGPKQLPIRYQF